MADQYLLEIRDLTIAFPDRQNKKELKTVVQKVSFTLEEGEVLGIVGESGSGKSMTALSIMDLLPENAKIMSGKIIFQGSNILEISKEQLRNLKGEGIAMIFQEPMTSLNPVMKVGKQVEEMVKNHLNLSRRERKKLVFDMFREAGLKENENIYQKYPHQLSGGMRQRVMIAMAMICKPRLLIADEPTTALDVTVQAQILELISMLNKKHKTAVIFISHDLGVIQSICSKALVMCAGKIVEEGAVEEIFYSPKEAYTKKLLAAVPGHIHNPGKEQDALKIQSLDSSDTVMAKIDNLYVSYSERKKRIFAKTGKRKVLHNLSFSIYSGEILGVVGESGSGKSTLAKAIAGLALDKEGKIFLKNRPRMVFQDPYSSLNPAKKINWILEEPLKLAGLPPSERIRRTEDILLQVGLDKNYAARYISELSGGQRQRVAIALAVLMQDKFIILDEPVSALDVTVQDQILKLLKKLRKSYGLTYLFISHDLNVIYQLCDRVVVMKEGRIVEIGEVETVYRNPKEKYTRQLLESIPGIKFTE